jgi:hypothetical protein
MTVSGARQTPKWEESYTRSLQKCKQYHRESSTNRTTILNRDRTGRCKKILYPQGLEDRRSLPTTRRRASDDLRCRTANLIPMSAEGEVRSRMSVLHRLPWNTSTRDHRNSADEKAACGKVKSAIAKAFAIRKARKKCEAYNSSKA